MSILGAIMTPHPPLLLPQIGKGQDAAISATTAAMKQAARFVAELSPETLVVISPHATAYADYNHISPGREAQGDFGHFGAPFVKVEATYDESFAESLSALCEQEGLAAGTLGERDASLDHGTMIPLHFIFREFTGRRPRVVRIGISGLPPEHHYKLGMHIQKTADTLQRKVVVVASGDLSHKLKEDGPYGLSPDGAMYDKTIMDIMARAAFAELFAIPDSVCASAAECGHRSFLTMAGCLDGLQVESAALSYEGPFGVGYGVCTFKAGSTDSARHFLDARLQAVERDAAQAQAGEDAYVKLARQSFTAWVTQKQRISVPKNLPDELTKHRAGVFVTLHKAGQLRGCIGTISPTQDSLAEEIIQNAISACAQDPRFSPVQAHELTQIECSVDVLGEAEAISGMDELDPKRYGVIVSHGQKRGLLLPALDGVDTADEQVAIARRKAGIAPDDPITLQRFEVIRHH